MAAKLKQVNASENFVKTFELHKFRVFNAAYKEVLSGAERAMLDYILCKRLTYIRSEKKYYYGNTINISKSFKEELLETFDVSISTYQRLITKLVKDGIFFRVKKDFFVCNPYCFAKGENLHYLRENGPFRQSTTSLKADEFPFIRESFFAHEKIEKKTDARADEENDADIIEDNVVNISDAPKKVLKVAEKRTINQMFQKP